MILIDSSAWIEDYRPDGSKQYQRWVRNAIEADQAVINAIAAAEIPAFTGTEREHDMIASDFAGFHRIDLDRTVAHRASALGADLRHRGTTIPATDLLIHAYAERAAASLLHHDGHFRQIAGLAPSTMITALED